MSPDINSLSRSPSSSSTSVSHLPRSHEPMSPRTTPAEPSSTSTRSRSSRRPSMGRLSISERRQSTAGMNLSSSPVFATADPHHQRAPSLGELHQQFEQEQEAQVNRLLQQIHILQAQLQQYQQQNRSQNPQSPSPNLQPQDQNTRAENAESLPGLHESSSASRRGSRDDGAFYQAEASMLSRENQLLRQRIRELERQIGEMSTPTTTSSASAAAPAPAPGQAGSETVDPHTARWTDGKD